MLRQRQLPHARARHVAMPLGGIGTGNVAIAADGALRQWQLHNIGNHRGDLPGSFFALRVCRIEPPLNVVKVLQAPPAEPGVTATPLMNDDHVPEWQRALIDTVGGVTSTTFRSTYPLAEIDYHDDDHPVQVRLRTLTPMVPLDVDRSSIPAAMFTFTITNTDEIPVHGWLGGTAHNAVGYDGVTSINGVHARGYGGNTNRVRRADSWTALVMENHTLDPLAAGNGQMVLSCDGSRTSALAQWTEPAEFIDFLQSRTLAEASRLGHAGHLADYQVSGPAPTHGPSPEGATWNGGLAAPFTLQPGESVDIRFVLTWHFPNRYVNFSQFGPTNPQWGPTRFWLGNHYAQVYPDAIAVADRVQREWSDLESASQSWTQTLQDSGLNPEAVEHLAAQASIIRSPSCFRTADGAFFGFEGVQGVSTATHSGNVGGSCPLNCTHVWNYEQALAALFPELERSMRETELGVMQAPNGSIPHRVISPTYLPQLWDQRIGGPDEPALDGMLGVLLKTYREVRRGAGTDWLRRWWPHLTRLLAHIRTGWDPDGTGVLRGIQPSTHDIDLRGVNSFMGTLWLAALRATEEMARLLSEPALADELNALFKAGSAAYDELLFNGEYYIQVLDPDEPTEFQWGRGCLSDQLIGQWWAHLLDLGHILPADHVRSALRAVVRHNLRTGFTGFEHIYRVFADGHDTGLLMCSWPDGGRPAVPTRYCDEVWTGVEYQVAAHCLLEGLEAESWQILDGLWARYDGSRRNPYNQIECGDHYVRAMAGWSVLEAWTGQRFDAVTAQLQVREPRPGERLPVVLPTGWGYVESGPDGPRVHCVHGEIDGITVSVR